MKSCRPWTAARCLAPIILMLGACALPAKHAEPPERPDALEPPGGVVVSGTMITRFTWRAAATADRYEFHVFDRSTGDIERYYRRGLLGRDVCRIQGTSPVAVCSIEVDLALPSIRGHAWRVRAGNSAGWSGWTRNEFAMGPR